MTRNQYQAVRGTHDYHGGDYNRLEEIITTAAEIVRRAGFQPLMTPIFEHTGVFQRTLGETSDIVGKEMYTFDDRGGESITLRPEGTAPAIRALISNGMLQRLPQKIYYHGPMFRYERPQKGRLRQFSQFGIEVVGDPSSLADADAIILAQTTLESLGVPGIRLLLNTIGSAEDRAVYRQKLVAYFKKYRADLSEDSQRRLETNPLRILDSKAPEDHDLIADAPNLHDYLSKESAAFFDEVCAALDFVGVAYEVSPRLVRGLDYYNHTTFEFVSDRLGAQATVLAGGRYNNLVAEMGGPDLAGVGWALGVERLSLIANLHMETPMRVAILAIGGTMNLRGLALCCELRNKGLQVELLTHDSVGKALKAASKRDFHQAIIYGEDELGLGAVMIKNLATGDQTRVKNTDIFHHLISNRL